MIEELVRIGIVSSIYPERGTARVQLVDVDDQVSYELPVVFRKTLKDKDYWMPDVGEHVVCLFCGQGLEQGFILGAIYSEGDTVPVISKNKWYKKFEDGSVIEYDRSEHKLIADINGDIEIKATGKCSVDCVGQIYIKSANNITIQAPSLNMKGGSPTSGIFEGTFNLKGSLNIEGDINVTGNIHAAGTIIDDSGNTNHHSH